MTFTGILLAAGRGKRFDPAGRSNKLLQTLDNGELVVVASARHLLAVLPRVVAAVRPGDEQVAAELRALGCEVHVCPDADRGMAASLTYAIGLTRASPGWLIALGDMPHVQADTMRVLVQAIGQGAHIAAPVYQGQRGNPVAFSAHHLERLLALEGDQGARSILKNHSVNEVIVSDNGILRDIDTPADL